MALRLILLGPPASGKGTQGRRIAEQRGLDYLSTGALLREVLTAGGPVAAEIAPVLARGGYIDDDRMCHIMADWLRGRQGGWVLDGFPRTLAQDDFLREALLPGGIDAAIALEVPKEELLRRIAGRVECPSCRWSGQREQLVQGGLCPRCGTPAGRRADDDVTNFLHRYEEYETHTLPVIERHAAQGTLIRCDATRDVEIVSTSLAASLEPLSSHGQAS
ncbi:MAG: nucleoside monophosphate kinase [Akkermansiaceae bacterium]|jgi:adenylate kinase|nr:nucleoside monophosphate kinase [Akkermansiaceae bacterium]